MRRAIRGRLRILSIGLFLVVVLLITRLYFVQIVHGADFALRAERQYISASQELYDRGSIYFTRKDGTIISAATLSNGFTIAMTPKRVTDPSAAFAALSTILSIDEESFFESAARLDDPYEVIARRVSEEDGKAIEDLKIDGIQLERERWRSYPGSTRAAQSIGFVAFDDDDSLAGRFGLERYYNDVLSRGSVGLFGELLFRVVCEH
ncbi:hypothetical protein KJ848_03065 [Patescibacteria group bacterium]|nr:hypothetical protein [Patescibacteria group bacterium]